ncbi:MAG: cache domain-containing protein [Pontibacter sp.]|nr:cache domain-containing protein [Pontibacter sp.]
MKPASSFIIIVLSLVILGFYSFEKIAEEGYAATGTELEQGAQGEAMLQDSTRQMVMLVKNAASLVQSKGEAAFDDFRQKGSKWRQGDSYIFVLDTQGNMLVHADPQLEGKNQLDLKDVNGKPIVVGLLNAATATPGGREGWYHYEWPVPGGLLPRWKSSYVRQVKAPSGKTYVVGSGMYNDRMERAFVVDLVNSAAREVNEKGKAAFPLFHDPAGPYLAKDTYIFVITMDGVEVVNPAFPSIEGRNNLDVQDAQGKYLTREIIKKVQTADSGWVDYMWPKPGESVPSQKSAYVRKAMLDGKPVAVGAGVYSPDAPKLTPEKDKATAPEIMALVRDAAAELEKRGEKAYPDFRKKGSKWFKDDTYLFIWSLDSMRVFHAADPSLENIKVNGTRDVHGRPYGQMFLEVGHTPKGEGWVHYMWPEPGDLFPTWKSSYLKRVQYPSGKKYLVGAGIYNMQMDSAFIKDVVDRAAALVADSGKAAFDQLRDKKGPYYFMDTYVFVENPEGVELVNPAQPVLEGRNLIQEKDTQGKLFVKDYIEAAMRKDSAWVNYYWYKPGQNSPVPKHTYVRKVQHNGETYIVGSGFYGENRMTSQSGRR